MSELVVLDLFLADPASSINCCAKVKSIGCWSAADTVATGELLMLEFPNNYKYFCSSLVVARI